MPHEHAAAPIPRPNAIRAHLPGFIYDADVIPTKEACSSRSWRAKFKIMTAIIPMTPAVLAAFEREYALGNYGNAHPKLVITLELVPPPEERVDGWFMVAAGEGSRAATTDIELCAKDEDGADVGTFLRWDNRDNDLWGLVVWLRPGEDPEAWKARSRKVAIDMFVGDLVKQGIAVAPPADASEVLQ